MHVCTRPPVSLFRPLAYTSHLSLQEYISKPRFSVHRSTS
nr:MAG TPA: hypothetical protein [Caudoviricetes sp.]